MYIHSIIFMYTKGNVINGVYVKLLRNKSYAGKTKFVLFCLLLHTLLLSYYPSFS